MNKVRVALATVLLFLLCDAVLAREPMRATLVIPDARILPGVPFDFWVELHNPSETLRIISICEPLQVRPVSGEPLRWTVTSEEMNYGGAFSWSHGGEAVVGPGETKFLAIPAYSGLMSGGFFRQRILSAAGRRLSVTLSLCEHVSTSSGYRAEKSSLLTSEAEIEIVSPTGSDALVWNFIQESSRHPWTPADMALPQYRAMWESVRQNYPDSNYAPYATLMTGQFLLLDLRDQLARYLLTIERFPDSPVLEWLHIGAWQTARALQLRGVMLAEGAIVRRSKRPTTRLLAFGNER